MFWRFLVVGKVMLMGLFWIFLVVAGQFIMMVLFLSVLLLFLGIGALVFIHACIVGRAFRGGIRAAAAAANSRGAAASGLSPEDLEKLPCYDYKAGEKEKGSGHVECAVCLESFQIGERCRMLPVCKHSYHLECVDSWLLRAPICPICRTRVDQWKGLEGQAGRFSGMGGFESGDGDDDGPPVVLGVSVTMDQSPLHASTLD